MNLAEAYVVLCLAVGIPVGICLICAKAMGIRMNLLTMGMMPFGFVFWVAGTVSGNRLLFIPAVLLFLGHILTIRAVEKSKHVYHL